MCQRPLLTRVSRPHPQALLDRRFVCAEDLVERAEEAPQAEDADTDLIEGAANGVSERSHGVDGVPRRVRHPASGDGNAAGVARGRATSRAAAAGQLLLAAQCFCE